MARRQLPWVPSELSQSQSTTLTFGTLPFTVGLTRYSMHLFMARSLDTVRTHRERNGLYAIRGELRREVPFGYLPVFEQFGAVPCRCDRPSGFSFGSLGLGLDWFRSFVSFRFVLFLFDRKCVVSTPARGVGGVEGASTIPQSHAAALTNIYFGTFRFLSKNFHPTHTRCCSPTTNAWNGLPAMLRDVGTGRTSKISGMNCDRPRSDGTCASHRQARGRHSTTAK